MDFSVIGDIIVAIIAAAAGFGGSILANNRKIAVLETKLDALKERIDSTSAERKEQIETLSTRVDKHNTIIERVTAGEIKLDALEREIERLSK